MDQILSNTQPQGDPVAEAIARRGLNAPSQMAPDISGAMGAPAMNAPTPVPTPTMSAPAPQSAKFVPKDSHELLISTLQESLKNEYKLKEDQLKLGAPQMAPTM